MASPLNALKSRSLELGPPAAGGGAWRNWRLTLDEDRIAWLLLDRPGAGVNTLSAEVLSELDAVLGAIETENPAGLVLRSAKPSGFIAGADINELRGVADARAVEERLRSAHAVIDRLAALRPMTVAVIHGHCLGGGLEVALACDRRIAISGARLGFPEVLLGLHPGLGGTARATSLINPVEAMTLMLTGRSIDARRAKALGLVDAVTEERHVRRAVREAVAGRLAGARRGLVARAMATDPGRRMASRRMRAEAQRRAPAEHYPAPHALIELWERHGGDDRDMRRGEIASFSRLLTTETAQNLVRVFFLREGLKKRGAAGGSFPPGHVHVIGAGTMGGDIAAWCAWQGLVVTLSDLRTDAIAVAIGRAARLFDRIGKDSRASRDALDRLIPDTRGSGIRRADIVIEAAPERLEIKQAIYAAAEPLMKAGALLASNTSSIPLEALREGLARPERFVGLHFFNPVPRMQLVEVVAHDGAAEEALAQARAFVGAIDRLPAQVRSAPGFLVNRALTPYLVEALVMVGEGARRETIDRAAERFGMPMGPIELADRIGLDICLEVARILGKRLQRPLPPLPPWLAAKVEAGDLGVKTGRGLYEWKRDRPLKASDAPEPGPEMTDRLILPILNACVACLGEGVADSEETIDAAMIFATGFAPFRGGPMHYARRRGAAEIRATLQRLADRHGERFRPDPGWERLI